MSSILSGFIFLWKNANSPPEALHTRLIMLKARNQCPAISFQHWSRKGSVSLTFEFSNCYYVKDRYL